MNLVTENPHEYVVWLGDRVAAERISAPPRQFRQFLTQVVHALEHGKQFMAGALLPSQAMMPIRQNLLPTLQSELSALGGPWIPSPKPPSKWTVHSPEKQRELRTALTKMEPHALPPTFAHHVRLDLSDFPCVGFAPETDLLLVFSRSGLGVFGPDGTRLARSETADFQRGEAGHHLGIGPIKGIRVELMGGFNQVALRRETPRGWRAEVLSPDMDPEIWFEPVGNEPGSIDDGCVRLAQSFGQVRAIGYSDSGGAMVVLDGSLSAVHLFS